MFRLFRYPAILNIELVKYGDSIGTSIDELQNNESSLFDDAIAITVT